MLNKKGFTLIELLIVIVIIGLLAAVVIAAINPVEARNRAVDTGTNSDATEIYNAISRYYVTKGSYPWGAGAINKVPASTHVPALITANELKSEFNNRTSLATIFIYAEASASGQEGVRVCFVPISKAFIDKAYYSPSATEYPSTRGSVAATNLVCVPE